MMKRTLLLLTWLFLLSAKLYAVEPVIVSDDDARCDVSPYLEYYKAPSDNYTFSEIKQLKTGWKKSKRTVPNFGYTDSVYWFRFSLRNSTEKPLSRYLEIAYPLIERLQVFVPSEDGKYKTYTTGSLLSMESRDIEDRNFVFYVQVPTGQAEFYLKVKTESSLEIPVYIWSQSGFIERCNRQLPLLWGYFGMLIMTMLYYFFLFMTEERENHFYCSVFILSIALCNIYLTGFGFQYLFANASWLNKRLGYYLFYFVIASGVLFARSNFSHFSNLKWFGDYVCRGILWGWFFFMVAGTIAGFGKITQVIMLTWGMLSTTALVFSLFYCSFSTMTPNYTMLFGTMFYIAGVLAYVFKSLGILPSNMITSYGHLSGSAVMVLFFAQGVYENILKSRKKLAELSQSRRELERIINQSTATALLLRADKVLSVEFVSDNIREFGYLPEDLLSGRNNYIEMVHPDDRSMFLGEIEQIYTENVQKRFSQEYRIVSSDNQVFWVDDRKWIRRDENKNITHIQCVIMNITGRKKLEIELSRFHETELLLSAVTSNFISLHPESISTGIEKSLELVGAFIGSGRGYSFLLSRDGKTIRRSHSWRLEGGATDQFPAKGIFVEQVPFLKKMVSESPVDESGEHILLLNEQNRDIGGLNDILQVGTFECEVIIPLSSENRFLGILGFSFEKKWDHGQGQLLTNVARVFSNIFARIRYDEDIKEYQTELRLLSSELVLAEEKERRRIAIEIHDRIGHALANCRMKLGRLQSVDEKNEKNTIINEIKGLVEQSIEDTQTLTFSISPHILYDVGLEAAVDWLAEQTEKEYDIRFEFLDDMTEKPLTDSSRILLYQIVRELVFNVVKHSGAEKSRIILNRQDETIIITIQDNGVGFDSSNVNSGSVKEWDGGPKKFGLFSVQERLRNANGTLKILSEKGKGSSVTVTYPLDTDTADCTDEMAEIV